MVSVLDLRRRPRIISQGNWLSEQPWRPQGPWLIHIPAFHRSLLMQRSIAAACPTSRIHPITADILATIHMVARASTDTGG